MSNPRAVLNRHFVSPAASLESLEPRQLLAFTPDFGLVISGANQQAVRDIATDSVGNSYVVGTIGGSTDFDPARRRTTLLDPVNGSGYVAKYSASGRLLWAQSLLTTPAQVAVDPRGNIFIAGSFAGEVDFDTRGASSFPLTSSDEGQDGFVLKLDANGAFLSANQFTAGHDTVVTGIGLDPEGYLFVSATSESGMLQATPFHGGEDDEEHHDGGIITKFNARLRNVFLNTLAGEEADIDTAGMAIDPTDGGVYLIGVAEAGTDLDPSALVLRNVRHATAYLLKLDSAGDYMWHTGYSPSSVNLGAVTVDSAGNAILVGSFHETLDFNPATRRTFEITAESVEDSFIAKFSSAGKLAFAHNIGGGGNSHASSVEVFGDDVIVGGLFAGRCDFNPGRATFRLTSVGSFDGFVSRFNTQDEFDDAFQYGNETGESSPVLAMSRAGLVIGGSLAGKSTPAGGVGVVDFDPGAGVLELTPRRNDGGDGFIVRYS